MPTLDEFQAALEYRFQDASLLTLALTHPSVGQDIGAATRHNQRLEFLGDAVLQLALTAELYDRYPDAAEGTLTKARALLVNRHSLAEQSRALNIGDYLILSRGEESTGGRERQSALADAFEAVLGAIYLDGGMESARTVILRLFRPVIAGKMTAPTVRNPKGELQEMLQAQAHDPPTYEIVSIQGPDHDRLFECVVTHGGREIGRGVDKSKKAAESQAAAVALAALRAEA